MATSPNYGWLEPDNTDLVKNGALAIRTLGNAIDTTMATMTPKSTVTAKGDLVAATAASTPARLAVGNNGETLVADSSTSTGLRYQGSMAAGKNAIINGGFDVWQRGTSFANPSIAYTADRWQAGTSAAATVSRQASDLTGFQYFARYQRTAGSALTTTMTLATSLESSNSIPYAGKTVTLSFYARRGANYSATSNLLSAFLYSGTGTDQSVFTAYSGANIVVSSGVTLTTSWQRFSITGTVPTNATELAFYFDESPTGTAGAADYYDVTGVQLELGSVATAFQRAGGTIQGELAACQRYYYRNTSGTAYAALSPFGVARNTVGAAVSIPNPVQMRTIPTSMEFGSLGLYDGGTVYAITALTLVYASATYSYVEPTVASGLTAGKPYVIFSNNSASGYIAFNAEL